MQNPFDEKHRFVHFDNWRVLKHDKEALYRFNVDCIDKVRKIQEEANAIYDAVAKYVARSEYVPYIAVLKSEFYKQQQHTNKQLKAAQDTLLLLNSWAETLMGITPENDFSAIPQCTDEPTDIEPYLDYKSVDIDDVDANNAIFLIKNAITW